MDSPPSGIAAPAPAEDAIARLGRERFGIASIHPLQRCAIGNILDYEADGSVRQLVLLPTGFGKSLCFQLPALILPGPTLVIYPLLALMADQKRSLDAKGIGSALFRGGMSAEERRQEEARVLSGEARIIITNPESLVAGRLCDFLAGVGLSHIAIDEAHCVSEWGETFRPAYLELGKVVERLDPPVISAFTATASPTVSSAVCRVLFKDQTYRCVTADPDRPNIHFSVHRTMSRSHSLRHLLLQCQRPAIVFCPSRDTTEILARTLGARTGLELRFYHAGLSREEKKEVEAWFMQSHEGVLTATCAYGMGVDKSDIRTVIHYEAPSSIEAYLQEAGRAGRDRKPSKAILLVERGRIGRKQHPSASAHDPIQAGASVAGKTADHATTVREEREKLMAAYGGGNLYLDRSDCQCRRHELMSMMGTRLPPGRCSGCDVCDGSLQPLPTGLFEVLVFFGRNGRRFGRREANDLLIGKSAAGITRCAGWGSLRTWSRAEITELLAAAQRAGILCERKTALWRDRLWLSEAGQRAWKTLPSSLPGSPPPSGRGNHQGRRYESQEKSITEGLVQT